MQTDLHAAADPSGLWSTLSTFEIGSRPARFERALADANGWSDAYAARVIQEYRRFLYLASVARFEVTPSTAVDAAWHLHLEDEDHYRNALCARLLGRELRHLPGSGEAGEDVRHQAQYGDTLALYEDLFGPAPSDIWPKPGAWLERDARWRRDRKWIAAIIVALGCAIFALLVQPGAALVPLGLAIAFGAGMAIDRIPSFSDRRRRKSGSSCGSSSGCSGSSSDGDCASCGGGGCGGGD